MKYNKKSIKEGITLHTIETDKFKTNLLSVFLTTPLERQNVTYNALLPMVLRRGNNQQKTQEELSIALEEMYGASFDCGVEKTGDNQALKFYLETINDTFLPTKEDVIKQAISTLFNIVFNPILENNKLKEEYVNSEKENLKQIIESKKDNKAKYAQERCIEEMYKEKAYGLYKFGYCEDIAQINTQNLYQHYQNLINNCKIDIFVSGQIEKAQIEQIVEQNENIKKLNPRKAQYNINQAEAKQKKQQEDIIQESMDITQGKLVIGMDLIETEEQAKFVASVYNAILGGTANSKLFQNVREKESLAYTAGSSYIRPKNNILIKCGIEIENYEKAVKIIKQQIEDMKTGNFSDEDLQNAKTSIISSVKFIPDEQDTALSYHFGQELANTHLSIDEYIKQIETVTKEEIQKLANQIEINTIYFLKN